MRTLRFSFLILNIWGCNDLSGHLGVSRTINDSRKRGVFITEYRPLTNPIIINDSIKIRVENIYLENCWRYNENTSASDKIDGYQMILESDKEDLIGFTVDWTIGVDSKRNWRFSNVNNIMTDFDELPTDTISWKVQKGNSLDSLSKKEIIGEFKLVRKN